MADIDKGLPNVKRPEDEVVTENFEEVDVAEELGKGPVEITDEEDGGATVDFDPQANPRLPGTEEHFHNLGDLLPNEILEFNFDLKYF